MRATKGGQIGANGEFYKGGQFLNTVKENPKGQAKKKVKKPRKVQIEPYVWVSGDQMPDDHFPIMLIIGSTAKWKNETEIEPWKTMYYGDGFFRGQSIDNLCDLWNKGERFAQDLS